MDGLSEREAQTEAELALVNRLTPDVVAGASELAVTAEAPDRAVVGEDDIRHVSTRRVSEVRRVGEVERLRAKLHPIALGELELAEDPEVEVAVPWPAQGIEPGRAETLTCWPCYRGEGERVEVALPRPDAAQDLDLGLDLIGALGVVGCVKRGPGRAGPERDARLP